MTTMEQILRQQIAELEKLLALKDARIVALTAQPYRYMNYPWGPYSYTSAGSAGIAGSSSIAFASDGTAIPTGTSE